MGILVITQCIAFPEETNLACLAIVVGGVILVGLISLREKIVQKAPTSVFIVLIYVFATLYVPLLGATLEGKPIVFNLQMPYSTFGYSAVAACTLAVAHLLYLRILPLKQLRGIVIDNVGIRLGLFRPPTTIQLWAMGGIGLAANALTAFVFGTKVIKADAILPQLVQGFGIFAYAPVLIPLASAFWNVKRISWLGWVGLALYGVVVLVLAMALNTRGLFVLPAITCLYGLVIAMLANRIRLNLFNWKLLVPMAVVLFVLMPAFGNLALAMKIARGQRGVISNFEMIQHSIDVFFDPGQMERYDRMFSAGGVDAGQWDERYLRNEFFHRLTPTKYTDNGFYYTAQFGEQERERLASFSRARLLALFPTPFLKLAGLDFNKWSVLNLSFGDWVYYARTGFAFAGFRGGSNIANGIVLSGMWFWPIFAVVGMVVFFLADLFYLGPEGVRRGLAIVSPLFLLGIFNFSGVLTGESIVSVAIFAFRSLPQMVILYALVVYGTRVFNGLMPAGVAPRRHPQVTRR